MIGVIHTIQDVVNNEGFILTAGTIALLLTGIGARTVTRMPARTRSPVRGPNHVVSPGRGVFDWDREEGVIVDFLWDRIEDARRDALASACRAFSENAARLEELFGHDEIRAQTNLDRGEASGNVFPFPVRNDARPVA